MTKATAASVTPKATKKLLKKRESPELHRSPALPERLLGAAEASLRLSQASLAPRHRVFPTAKFPQPLTHLIATGAAPLGELDMILSRCKTSVETPEASRSCLRTPLGQRDSLGARHKALALAQGLLWGQRARGPFGVAEAFPYWENCPRMCKSGAQASIINKLGMKLLLKALNIT